MFTADSRMNLRGQKWVKGMQLNTTGPALEPDVAEPARPTTFETKVAELNLTPDLYADSAELKKWVTELVTPRDGSERSPLIPRYKEYYIPEWLLVAWDISIDGTDIDEEDMVPFSEMMGTDFQLSREAKSGTSSE